MFTINCLTICFTASRINSNCHAMFHFCDISRRKKPSSLLWTDIYPLFFFKNIYIYISLREWKILSPKQIIRLFQATCQASNLIIQHNIAINLTMYRILIMVHLELTTLRYAYIEAVNFSTMLLLACGIFFKTDQPCIPLYLTACH